MILLRDLYVEDVTHEYVNWFQSPEIIRYSESRFKTFSLDGQKQYIMDCNQASDIKLFGIFDDELHIGNIVLDKINMYHLRAEIAYIIGDKRYHGKGIGTKAVKFAINYSKNHLKLTKLYAGVAEKNYASISILKKNNFIEEGRRKNYFLYDNVWMDMINYTLFL